LTRSHSKPANRTPIKRLFWRVVVIVFVLFPGAGAGRLDGFAQAANPSGSGTTQEPTTVDELRTAFGVSQLHSDYVVVVDVSGSMSEEGNPPPWPVVRAAYDALIDAIPDGDQLTLITFDSIPQIQTPVTLGSDRTSLKTKLPQVANGNGTNIGAALNAAVSALDQPNAADTQTLIFITDGSHNGKGPFEVPGNAAWLELQGRAQNLESRRPIAVRALGIGNSGKAGAELVNSVFSKPEIVVLEGPKVRDYLTAEVENAKLRLLGKQIQRETTDGLVRFSVKPKGKLESALTVTAEVSSNLAHLGVDVDLAGVTATDATGKPVRVQIVGGSRTVHVAPGTTEEIKIEVKPAVGASAFFEMPPPKTEELDITLKLDGAAQVTPQTLLKEKFGTNTAVKVTNPDLFTLSRTVGKSYRRFFLEIALAVLAVLAALRAAYWAFKKPSLRGALFVKNFDEEPTVFKLKGTKMILDGAKLGHPGGPTRMRLYTKRRKWKSVYVTVLEGTLEKRNGRKWEASESGDQLMGQYRMNQETGPKFSWKPNAKLDRTET
jgi:von Willebrand factor type A domain